jgi:subtilase family serine protease
VAVRYFVHVINRGQTAALRFGVSLAVDGGAAATQTVTNLAPGETRKLVFSGPPCEDTVTAVADPEDVLRETIERDNSLTAPCPSRR